MKQRGIYHKWNEKEEKTLLQLTQKYGHCWKQLQLNFFPKFSVAQIRNKHYQLTLNQPDQILFSQSFDADTKRQNTSLNIESLSNVSNSENTFLSPEIPVQQSASQRSSRCQDNIEGMDEVQQLIYQLKYLLK